MDKNNRILIGAVLILIIAVISLNFNEITGYQVKSTGIIKVTLERDTGKMQEEPVNAIKPGERIKVEIDTGGNYIYKKAYIYDHNSLVGSFLLFRHSYKETGKITASTTTSASWNPGPYKLCVIDNNLKKKGERQDNMVCGNFIII